MKKIFSLIAVSVFIIAVFSGCTNMQETFNKISNNSGVEYVLLFVVAIIIIGIGLSIANKDGGIFSIAFACAIMILLFGYMFITTSW